MDASVRRLLIGLLAGTLLAATRPSVAQPEPPPPAPEAPPAESGIEHGTRSGRGDSRGPGRGDGLGRVRAGEAGVSVESRATGAERGPEIRPTAVADESDDLLYFKLGDFVFRPRFQYRARYYHREGFDFSPGNNQNFVRHRARLGAEAWWQGKLGVVVALQDVRTWGEEVEPLFDFDADGFDARIAYLEARPVEGLRLRLGRQLIRLLNERLVGAAAFSEQERSFDALRIMYGEGGLEAELGYAIVAAALETATTGHFGFAQVGYEVTPWLDPHAVATVEGDTTGAPLLRGTVGGYVHGAVGSSVVGAYEVEGYYQYGREGEHRFDGWMAGGTFRATAQVPLTPYLEVHGYLISGDDDLDDEVTRHFIFSHPARHKFYGEVDLFLDFPEDTAGRGLRDLGAAAGFAPGGVKTQVAFFVFDAMEPRGGPGHFGWELDFRASYPIWKYLGVDAFYGFFAPGALFGSGQIEHAAFVTINAEI